MARGARHDGSVRRRLGIGFRVVSIGLASVAFLLCAGLAGPATSQTSAGLATGRTRHDWHQEGYLEGFLTWNDGKGGITWDASAPTSPQGGSGAVQEFKSAPLEESLYLNAGHQIQVELLLTGTCDASQQAADPKHLVELFSDGTYLGGIGNRDILFWNRATDNGNPNYAPPWYKPPVNWCWRAYRIHPEVDILEKGTVLTVRVTRTSANSGQEYGFVDDHRSILRLPVFTVEEAFYRFPELRYAGEASTRGESTDMSASSVSAGWAAVGAAPGLIGRRFRRTAAIALVLATASAGCFAPGPEAADPGENDTVFRAKIGYQDDSKNETGLASNTTGAVMGQARDARERPVAKAHVTLGPRLFMTADNYGQFSFSHVEPGNYTLRVDHKDYGTASKEVDVRPGIITRVEIFLEVVGTVTDNSTSAHRHPKFPPGGKVVVVDKTLPSAPSLFESIDGWNEVGIPGPFNIFPGTRNIEVVITWSSTAVSKVAIVFQPIPSFGLNFTMMAARASGVPFNIATTWEMADSGHQFFTEWKDVYSKTGGQFRIIPVEDISRAYATPVVFHVKITLFEGVVPLEPKHEDFWNGLEAVPVLTDSVRQTYGYTTWTATGRVPPETKWIHIRVTAKWDPYQDCHLMFVKTANIAPNAPLREWTRATLIVNGSLDKEWRLELKPEQTDPYYSKAGSFRFRQDSTQTQTSGVEEELDAVTHAYVQPQAFTMNVWANRSAMPP